MQKLDQSFNMSFLNIVPFSQVQQPVLLGFLAVGILVGAFGGVNAIRNYLKV